MKSNKTTRHYRKRNTAFFLGLFILAILSSSCKKGPGENDANSGYATGKVTDTKGNPLSGVEIAIENALVGYYSSANGVSDNNGFYKIKLSNVGSFHASAYLNRDFNGKQYKLELNCNSNDAFGNCTMSQVCTLMRIIS